MDFTQVFHVKLTLFLLATHKFHYQLVAKYLYILYKAPTCFGQDVWPENVGALCNIYNIYIFVYILQIVGSEFFFVFDCCTSDIILL